MLTSEQMLLTMALFGHHVADRGRPRRPSVTQRGYGLVFMLPGCPANQRQKLGDGLPLRFSAPEDGKVQPGGNTTMPEWFDGVAQEWSLIGAAPISFAIALVVVIIVVWAILHWFHRRMLSSKDILIEVLQSRLADYRNVLEGASPREAAYKITQLKGKLEAIKGMPRDENTIYQKGKRIAEVVGIRIDPANNSVVFDRMRIAGHLDQATHVEFKNLVLAFVGLEGFSQTRQGRTIVNAQFSIVGNRSD